MNCRTAEKYIYLGKDFADTGKKSKFLKHISSCAECSRRFEEMRGYNKAVAGIQAADFSDKKINNLSKEIVGIISKSKYSKEKLSSGFFADIFYFPLLKIAAASIILLVTLFYFGEEYNDFTKIRSLEIKYAANAESSSNKAGLSSMQEIVKSASSFYLFLSGEKKLGELPGGWMLIKKSEMIKLLDEYRKYLDKDVSLLKQTEELQKIYGGSDLHKIMFDKEKVGKFLDRYYRQEN